MPQPGRPHGFDMVKGVLKVEGGLGFLGFLGF